MDASGFSVGVSGVMGGLADSSGSYSKTSWILPSVGEKSGDRGLPHWMLRGDDMFDVVFDGSDLREAKRGCGKMISSSERSATSESVGRADQSGSMKGFEVNVVCLQAPLRIAKSHGGGESRSMLNRCYPGCSGRRDGFMKRSERRLGEISSEELKDWSVKGISCVFSRRMAPRM
jgi:hypothetical protein